MPSFPHHSLAKFALCTLLLGPPLLAQLPADVEQAMQTGSEAMHNGHPEQAEQAFRKAAALAPDAAIVHLDLGLALVQQGHLQDAEAELKRAAALDPNLPGAPLFLGITEYELGHIDEARTALAHQLALQPESPEANMWLGVVELSAGKPEAAVAPLDKAAQLAPDNLDILDYRGRAHALVSTASYARMSRLNPNSWHVHRALAQSYADQGQPKQAITEYQAALASNPRNPDLYEALGDEQRKVAQFDAAQKSYEKELALSPNNPVALFNLGSIAIDRDDAASGLPMIEKASASFNQSAPVFFYLGLGLSKLNRNQEAVDNFKKSIALDPSGDLAQRSWYEQSRAYRKMGKPADSQAALVQFTRLREASQKKSKDAGPFQPSNHPSTDSLKTAEHTATPVPQP